MKKPPPPKLRACDVLNWDYLVKIAEEKSERDAKTVTEAVRKFAYDFTSTADEDVRDNMLIEWLQNGTYKQSKDTAEEIVARLADSLKTDLGTLRKFAKENGVRLKKG